MQQNLNKVEQQSSLQKKLQLLSYIRAGNIVQIAKVTKDLSKNAKTNPQLYQKFLNFVDEHKQGLIQMEKDEKQDNNQNVQIINVDDDNIDDKQWQSDESIEFSDDSDFSEDQSKQQKQKSLFKQVQNIKPLLKQKKNGIQQNSKQQTLNPKIDSSKAKKQTVANPGKLNSVGFSKCQNTKSSNNKK